MTGRGGWVESPEPRRSQTRAPAIRTIFSSAPKFSAKR